MIRTFALATLLLLAACNRQGAADVTLDADAAQRNATAAKTLADLAAADAASQGPAPAVRDAPPGDHNADRPERAPPPAEAKADQAPDDADSGETLSNDS